MSQVSEIIVNWTPETSGRVSTLQIQSRIVGTSEWTEQASGIDASLGEFRFGSNAPKTDVQVRMRFRMVTGVYGAWSTDHIVTSAVTVPYLDLTGTPSKLSDINSTEGGKLGGIAPGADVTGNNTSKDTSAVGGIPAGTVIGAIKDSGGTIVGVPALQTATAAAQSDATRARSDLAAEVSRATGAETVIQTRTSTLESTVNTATTGLTARITTEETTRASNVTALSNRITTVESSINTPTTGLTARITAEETTRAAADSAIASRTTTLESNVGGTGIVKNPKFAAYTNAVGVPDLWSNDNTTSSSNGTRVAGELGGYACQLVSPAGVNTFITQYSAAGSVVANEWLVFEADVKLVAGTLNGAGLYGEIGGNAQFIFPFSTTPDATGVAPGVGTVGSIYRWRILAQASATIGNGALRYIGMGHYGSMGDTSVAATLVWNLLNVRPATAAEILAKKADLTLNTAVTGIIARMTTEETTRATNDTALSNRTTTLESTVNTPSTGLTARMTTEENARASADTALSNRTTTVEATVNNGSSGNAAIASRVTTTESAITSLNGKAAAYWQVSSVAGNNRAQLTVHADANGGAGVDIVGDTTFSGSLNVGPDTGQRCKITNNGVTVYDANNIMRVRLGLF